MAFWKDKSASPIQSHHFRVAFGDVSAWAVKSVTMPNAEVSVGEYQVGNHWFKYPGVHKWNDVTITVVDDKNTTKQLLRMFNKQGWVNPIGMRTYNGRNGGGRSISTDAPAMVDEARAAADASDSPWDADAQEAISAEAELNSRIDRSLDAGKRGGELFYSVSEPFGMKKETGNPVKIYQYGTLAASVSVEELPPNSAIGRAMRATYDWLNKPLFGGPREKPPSPVVQDAHHGILNEWELKNWFIKSINFGTHDYSSDELITMEVVISYDYAYALDDDSSSTAGLQSKMSGVDYK